MASLHGIYSGNVKGYQASPKPSPAPAPSPLPPLPAPAAQNGHYAGQTSQGESITFDVSGNGTSLTNLTIASVREQCTPPGLTLNADADGGSTVISAEGSFSISLPSYPTTVDQTPAVGSFLIQGKFSPAGVVAGTLSQGASFTSAKGVNYTCDSGSVSWTAARTA